jgi:hypothetical protein
MKRLLTTLLLAFAFLPVLHAMMQGAGMTGPAPVASGASGLQVDVWTDRPEGEVYDEGSAIAVYFRSNGDCYLTLYDIDTEGRVSIIFPRYPDDGFIYGGVTYRLPDYYRGLLLHVSGPTGIEYLHAVATRHPRAFRYRSYDGAYRLYIDPVHGDPFLAINRINSRIIHDSQIAATATVSFFVGSRVWYPRYMCADCHIDAPYRLDPYRQSCTHYVIRASGGFDYWWKYGYHPRHHNHLFAGAFWKCLPRPAHWYRSSAHVHLQCAVGFGNYHPVHPPRSPHTAVKYRNPAAGHYRGYTRNYVRVDYTDTYARRSGITRQQAERRAPVVRTGRERTSTVSGIGSNRTRNDMHASGGTSSMREERSRSTFRSRVETTSSARAVRERVTEQRSTETIPEPRSLTPGRARSGYDAPPDTRSRSASSPGFTPPVRERATESGVAGSDRRPNTPAATRPAMRNAVERGTSPSAREQRSRPESRSASVARGAGQSGERSRSMPAARQSETRTGSSNRSRLR